MKKIFKLVTVFSILMTFFTGCDNFLNSSQELKELMQSEIDYARAPLVNILVGHNNDEYGTVGTGVVNYSLTAKVGYAFEVTFSLKASAGNFLRWNAYTKYDPEEPANSVLLDSSYIEFLEDSQDKLTAKVKILKKYDEQIRLVPEVSAFPVMEVCIPSELLGVTPAPVTFNPAQPVKTLTPGQEYSIIATTTEDYGFSENAEDCWKVYRKDSLGNEIEIADGEKITITKNAGTQLTTGKSQSTIYITVDTEFSGHFYVSPKLITYPSMKVEVENFDSSLIKMSHIGTVSMSEGTPYEISLQTDPSVGFLGWKLSKKDNTTFDETEVLFQANNKTTTNSNLFETFSDDYIEVSSPSYEVAEAGKTSGKVKASIIVTLKKDMSDLEYSYYLLPQFFKYPVVNVNKPDGYASAGSFSLVGAGYLDDDTARMMMDDYEYTITYKTTEEFSFAEDQWIVYETSDPSKNLLNEADDRIEITKSSIVVDESGTSTCSISVILKHNFETNLNIKPIVAKKPSMNIAFVSGTPDGINFSLGGNTITSGTPDNDNATIKMAAGKVYTATVNIPSGYSFEGWRLVKEVSSNNKTNWITESTKSTVDIVESANLTFDAAVSAEKPEDYIRVYNAKYEFQSEGRNAGTTKATVDVSFKKELTEFSLVLCPVVKAVPEISFVPVNADYGTLSPLDVRNLYTESKINLSFRSTNRATIGTEIWKIKKLDPVTGTYSDYSANVGYTSSDLDAALKDPVLKTKNIIIYNNDTEPEVQSNSRGEYITTKTAVLYVNIMPDSNLQLSVTPKPLPMFSVNIDSSTKGSVTPSEAKSILVNEDYNISFISNSDYGFKEWKVTADGANLPVVPYNEISTTTASSFVVDLGSEQELTGSYSLDTMKQTFGSTKYSKILAVIYNTTKIESQSTEGVETVTAKFRIIKENTDSTVVVSPVTFKHSYFILNLENKTDGRYNPSSKTLMKAGKDYDFEFIFNGAVYSMGRLGTSINDPSGKLGPVFPKLFDSYISDWSQYSNYPFVIYADKSDIDDNTGIATRRGKIRLIKEFDEGVEIRITPYVYPRPKVSLIAANPDDISRLQVDKLASTTGAIYDYYVSDYVYECQMDGKYYDWRDPTTYADPKTKKIFSISATTESGKTIYPDPKKMWKVFRNMEGRMDDLFDMGLGNVIFTTESSFENYAGTSEMVFYNCRVESIGKNQYRALADIFLNIDEIGNNFVIEPQVHPIPEISFGPRDNGTYFIDGSLAPSKKQLEVGVNYPFELEASNGYIISGFELYSDSANITYYTYDLYTGVIDENGKLVSFTSVEVSADNKRLKGIIKVNEPVGDIIFNFVFTQRP